MHGPYEHNERTYAPPPTESSRGGVCEVAQSLSLNVCIICGASKSVQRCSCVSGSERTKCGASRSDQRRACDKEDERGTHFILRNTKKKAISYQKGTGSGGDTTPEQQNQACHPPCRIDAVSSWEPSPLPAGGSEYTPELIKEAIKKSYQKCTATRGTNHS